MDERCTDDTVADIKRQHLLARDKPVSASQSLPALAVNAFGAVGRPSDFARPGGFRRKFLGRQGRVSFSSFARIDSVASTIRHQSIMYARVTSAPSLTQLERDEEGMGAIATVVTFLKAMVGPTLLYMPHMFAEAGPVVAVLGILLSAALSTVGMMLLIELREASGLRLCTYPDIGRMAAGRFGWAAVEAALVTSQWLYCVGYPIFVAQNVRAVLLSFLAEESCPSVLLLMCLQLPLMAVYCWVRQIASLSAAMFAANLSLWGSLLVLYALLVDELVKHGAVVNTTEEWLDTTPRIGTILFASQAAVCFEGIGLVLPIRAAMRQPERFPAILVGSLAFIVAAFLAVGLLGFAAFGDATQTFITLNLEPSATALSLRAAFALAVLLCYPLQLFPAIQSVEHWLGLTSTDDACASVHCDNAAADLEGRGADSCASNSRCDGRGGVDTWQRALLRNVVRTAIVAVAFGFAVGARDAYDSLVSFTGGLCAVPLAFLFPGLFHYLCCPEQGAWGKARDLLLFSFGLVMAVTCTVTAVATWGSAR